MFQAVSLCPLSRYDTKVPPMELSLIGGTFAPGSESSIIH